MTSSTLTVRVDSDVARRLGNLAKATSRSRSYLAAEAIEEFLAVQEWQVQAIRDGLEQADRGDVVDSKIVRRNWGKKL